VGELISFVTQESLNSITGEDTGEAFSDVGNGEETCRDDVKLDWCNDVIFHPLSDKVYEERNARDVKAKSLRKHYCQRQGRARTFAEEFGRKIASLLKRGETFLVFGSFSAVRLQKRHYCVQEQLRFGQ
jgi:hypothetical protein